jgi:transcription elongation factor GreA
LVGILFLCSIQYLYNKKKLGGFSMAVSYMTEEGYNKILAEINLLETVKRPEISHQIAEARDKGDLSENAEYDAAKEAQGILEAKIAQLKGLIAKHQKRTTINRIQKILLVK